MRSFTARARGGIRFSYNDGLRSYDVKKPFEGVVTNLERRYLETESEWSREEIGRYMSATPCNACNGFRLKPEALAVKIAAKAHRRSLRTLGARAPPTGSRRCRKSSTKSSNEIA